jgi:hypothetical protein
MTAARLALLVVAFSSVSLSGCGTCCNLASHEPEPYGGVRLDFKLLGCAANTKPDSVQSGDPIGLLVVLGIMGTELACSFAADTLTLPLIRRWEAKRSRERGDSDVPVSSSASADPSRPCYMYPPGCPAPPPSWHALMTRALLN